jgi:hypothetical protein
MRYCCPAAVLRSVQILLRRILRMLCVEDTGKGGSGEVEEGEVLVVSLISTFEAQRV